jgi:hypothetical protein
MINILFNKLTFAKSIPNILFSLDLINITKKMI